MEHVKNHVENHAENQQDQQDQQESYMADHWQGLLPLVGRCPHAALDFVLKAW